MANSDLPPVSWTHTCLVHGLFTPVLGLVDELSQAENETKAVDILARDRNIMRWNRIVQSLEKAVAEQLPGQHLPEAVRTIADIHAGTRTWTAFSDVAIYLFRRRNDLKQAALQGWRAAKYGGTIPEDPFPVSRTAAGNAGHRPDDDPNPANASGNATPDVVATSPSGRVVLYGRADKPRVDGKERDKLTAPQYDVVCALLKAGENGLTKDQLEGKETGRGGGRGILNRLAKIAGWKAVIRFAETTGGRYRIL